MITVKSIYDDVALDNVNTYENGSLNFEMFNRISKRAELRMLDYLTGDVENQKPPAPYTSQKIKDWASKIITKFPVQVVAGEITKPENYYGYENMFMLSGSDPVDCDDENPVDDGKQLIELMDGSKFNDRSKTNIAALKPSFKKPIAKEVGETFEFLPKDLGSIVLEYYAYPEYAKIVTKDDPIFNDEVIDEDNSTNYSWGEYARELLIYFITDTFSIHVREQALKQFNTSVGKTIRDQK